MSHAVRGKKGQILNLHSSPKVRPYEHLSDNELWNLSGEAAELRLRLASLHIAEVEGTMISHGCPPKAAARQLADPMGRSFAARFHLDVEDAKRGDETAQARVAHVTHGWELLRSKNAMQ